LNRLTWHDGLIPPNELWIKVGGDRGGSSFKMSFQIINVPKPNSVKNSTVFALFEAPHSVSNLHIALDRYENAITDLQTSVWKKNRDTSLRTLDKLTARHTAFLEAGGNIKNAKHFCNVIGQYFFDIPLTQVCPPGLHITLGVFQHLFDLLEDECHELDQKTATTASTRLSSYEKYMEAKTSVTTLKEEKDLLTEQIKIAQQYLVLQLLTTPDPMQNTTVQSTSQYMYESQKRIAEIDKLMHQKETVIEKGFDKEDGVFVRALDAALSSFNVERQAYHGGSFIGNHIHQTLKPQNIATLCQSVIETAKENDISLLTNAQAVSEKFHSAFTLFSKCHKLYDGTALFSESMIDELEVAIDCFVAYYRATFSKATFTPKLHMLEDHMIPWIKLWNTGCGLMGEQGAESLHAKFNSTERAYNNMRDRVERMKVLLQNHLLQVKPLSQSLVPAPRQKGKKQASSI
uniref:Uncharacterized protein n=1 Tax=Amphimedon queenslandica TaxID=400682 RepID=A0A1X7V868_AMPQE